MSDPVLCYVKDQWAYFTHKPLSEQWGDDWDDAPYEHNAGSPYGATVRVAFYADMDRPCDNQFNSPYSVERINQGVVPWLVTSKYSSKPLVTIFAGCTLKDFIAKIEQAGGEVYLKHGSTK